jgi:hypothetical protein
VTQSTDDSQLGLHPASLFIATIIDRITMSMPSIQEVEQWIEAQIPPNIVRIVIV